MALFFYRAWAGEASENRGGVRCFLSSISFAFEYFVVVKATGNVDLFPTRLELTPGNPLYYTRYGYAALLGITLFGGLLLNGNNTSEEFNPCVNAGIYLLGYLVCPRALVQVPHAAIASLAFRLFIKGAH